MDILMGQCREGPSTGRSPCVRVAIGDRILSIDLLLFMDGIIQMKLMVAIICPKYF